MRNFGKRCWAGGFGLFLMVSVLCPYSSGYVTNTYTFNGGGTGVASGTFDVPQWNEGETLRVVRVNLSVSTSGGQYVGDNESPFSVTGDVAFGSGLALGDASGFQWFGDIAPTVPTLGLIAASNSEVSMAADDDGFPPRFHWRRCIYDRWSSWDGRWPA